MTPLMVILLYSSEYIFTSLYVVFYVLASCYLYKRFIKGARPKYPLGIWDPDDVYFPRFNIPRPIYRDFREHPEYFRRREEELEDQRRE